MTNTYQTQEIKQAYVDWLEQQQYGLAVTLNFRPNTKLHQAVVQAQRLWNMVDRAVFGGNAVKRHGERLNRICVLEGVNTPATGRRRGASAASNSSDTVATEIAPHTVTQLPGRSASFRAANPHYHCAVKTARDISYPQLAQLITDTWNAMRWAGRFSQIELIELPDRTRWLSYITKHVMHDAICLHTSTMVDPSHSTCGQHRC